LKSLFDGIAENEYMYLVHSFMLNLRWSYCDYKLWSGICISFERIIFTEPSFTLKKAVMWEKNFRKFS
jgi:hypothetical protein